ncbi:PleD family two-component system response regulator [Elusimicrobiota bacterium]
MNGTILVVDDNPTIIKMLESILEHQDYEVKCVETGEEGLELLQDKLYDLIIIDVVLPGLSGWDLCKILQESDRTKNVPIIVLTGKKIEADDEIKSFKLGAIDYMTKPFNTGVLLARIKARIESFKNAQSNDKTE